MTNLCAFYPWIVQFEMLFMVIGFDFQAWMWIRISFWHAKGFKIWKKIQKLILDGHFKYSLFSLIKILITFMSHICYHVGRYKIRRRNCKFTQLWFIFYEVLQVYILLRTGVILLCTKVKIVLEVYPTVIWFPQREI